MRFIFGHGPWYTEWHHIVDLWPAVVGGSVTAWALFKTKFFKGDGDE